VFSDFVLYKFCSFNSSLYCSFRYRVCEMISPFIEYNAFFHNSYDATYYTAEKIHVRLMRRSCDY